ncbi:hybrid sensor histidine kinase/response regulator [Rhodopseudomonas sp. B29]|uniref:hybrid sensor histidine kinase/response regulator n=1 Tax=Rhodopseudomonas sp. B29 TaxID=95607 RepID=UPI000345A5A6|nr:hybrid sensor histidine kinase/response regulator [Rhodopseudomonas sp. B29]
MPGEPVRILLLEDSDIDAELLAAHLSKAELDFTLDRVFNRRNFVAALERGDHDIILADYSLPDFDGLSALNIASSLQPELPFIFVSGVVGEEFATNALKRGATDYVVKRNLTRLATAVERALDQARQRVEARKTQDALSRTELSARLATEAAKLGLWDYDPTTRKLKWDASARAMLGWPPNAEVDYQTYMGACHPEDRDRLVDAARRATKYDPAADGSFAAEYRVTSATGQERWIAARGQALFEAEKFIRFVGVVRDVTDERRAQQQLEALTADLERRVGERTAERDSLWRLSPDLFAVIGDDGRLRRLNPAWSSMLGYQDDALIGSMFDLLLPLANRSAVNEQFAQSLQERSVGRFESPIRQADGEWRRVAWTAAPERDAMYVVGRDVTSERAAATALAQRNAELAREIEERERVETTLRQLQRLEAVGQLTAGVAHDFNNLLTVVLGNISFVEKRLTKPGTEKEIATRLGHMKTAAQRGATLTAQLLAFSRRQKLEPKPVDLNETVAGMRELLQSTMGGSIRIETVLKSDLWPALVDPTQIELIILNLAINARDAMEIGGALTVETGQTVISSPPQRPEDPAPGEYVVLTVNDTGTGIPPQVLDRVFEPFFTTKDVGKGSGLGLPQVFGFAKQSGGGIRIRTTLGEGTSVTVFLPRAAHALQSPAGTTATTLAKANPAEKTVLLVDDDSAVREVVGSMLREQGYAVLSVGSGSAALDVLRGPSRIDLLLVDYAMPGMSGVEVAKKAHELRPSLPTLFASGFADLKALEEVGHIRLIKKPFHEDELSVKLAEALQPLDDPKVVRLR